MSDYIERDAAIELVNNQGTKTDSINALARMKAALPKWIPVKERLPEECDRYLTVSIEPWFGSTVVDTMRWSRIWMYDGRPTEATVTHWMPLPTPPKEEK